MIDEVTDEEQDVSRKIADALKKAIVKKFPEGAVEVSGPEIGPLGLEILVTSKGNHNLWIHVAVSTQKNGEEIAYSIGKIGPKQQRGTHAAAEIGWVIGRLVNFLNAQR